MLRIRHFSVVPYSVSEMFNLINDINSYSEFIPGCSVIKILKQYRNELVAEIIPVSNKIVKTIITHNIFIKNKSIIIYLIQSPFKYFYGHWKFNPISQNTSYIEYIAYYEYHSIFMEKLFNYFFQETCSDIIKIFTIRASQLYD